MFTADHQTLQSRTFCNENEFYTCFSNNELPLLLMKKLDESSLSSLDQNSSISRARTHTHTNAHTLTHKKYIHTLAHKSKHTLTQILKHLLNSGPRERALSLTFHFPQIFICDWAKLKKQTLAKTL